MYCYAHKIHWKQRDREEELQDLPPHAAVHAKRMACKGDESFPPTRRAASCIARGLVPHGALLGLNQWAPHPFAVLRISWPPGGAPG